MNYEEKTLAQIIKEARNSVNISQRELAKFSNVAHTTIARIENGYVLKPTISTLERLSKTLFLDRNKLIDICNKEDETENNNISFTITRTKENAYEFDGKNQDCILDFLEEFYDDLEELLPNIGDTFVISFNGDNYFI